MLLNYFSCIILSIIQGLTEFLPISSNAHIIIFSKILNIMENNNFKFFKIIIQLGSSLAILIFFWDKIIKIIFNKIKYNSILQEKINILHIFISIFPIILVGLTFYKKIKIINNINYVIYGLFIGNILLYISEKFKPIKYKINNINNILYINTFFIGCFQCLALLPGVSRLGSTLSISLLLGIKRTIAIKFCLIISIPIIFGANLLELYKNYTVIDFYNIKIFFIGFLISFFISLIIIKKLIYMIKNISLKWFILYRLFLIIILLVLN
ncbi:undecaprenyl-diphosphatase [Enterobacteriaceae endosymbiont of Donacia bicoloricornis]|uniref:undecaprenyl-diphosphate phosphatase n=1 Tax=Enterobacteriaceae endosymbiont of Donacia bicoloricornis TaxID=2675772 RepID=UPI001449597F|nr:undecaprenyl-diphosphate phosphatase [Enterobacteriaceae endosymbiont of Donacia bicoloricornis]QJC37760.1 undecaprenyl-diphosphatase [Enterobacteriaceae endosymbiont of Donacia bicoloricornis]